MEYETEALRGGANPERLSALLRRFLRDFPVDRFVRARIAAAYIDSGDPAAALGLFPADAPAETGAERAVLVRALAASGAAEAAAALGAFLFDEDADADYRTALSAVPDDFDPVLERAALARWAVHRRSYREALELFRALLAEGPRFLFAHPETLSDLGKAFQYGDAADEGAVLFESWAALSPVPDAVRFRLFFYAGRMRRTAGDVDRANSLFTRALPYAPDAEQRDACLWYLLDGAAALSPASALPLLRKYAPSWKDAAALSDFLDGYCGKLVSGGLWAELVETLRIARPVAEAATTARLAYVVGRSVELGYVGADRPMEIAGKGAARMEAARSFYRIAFDADAASFYYRTMAAARLGEDVDPVPAEAALNRFSADGSAVGPETVPAAARPEKDAAPDPSDLSAFLFAFFDYGLGHRVYEYARPHLDGAAAGELRSLAARFNVEGRYGDSIRTMGLLSRRSGYALTRTDMELLYPRAYAREVAASAALWGIDEDLLFGLVRTESAFIPDAVSRAGAEGLAQLMRPTAAEVVGRIKASVELRYRSDGTADLSHPQTNLHLGAWYLANLDSRLDSPLLSLFAYNGGITRVRRWRADQRRLPEDLFLETVPIKETRTYASKVLAAAAVYGYLYRGTPLARAVADYFPAGSQ